MVCFARTLVPRPGPGTARALVALAVHGHLLAQSSVRCRASSPSSLANVKHYTQQPSELQTSSPETALIEVRGGGFVTRQMVHETLDRWKGVLPSSILVDLREVAGYESGCAALAHRWLLDAHQSGVQRIACIASSSVLRTLGRVASSRATVALQVFEDEPTARSWLTAQMLPPEPPTARAAPTREL
jgi:hypothetical protein